MAKKVRPRRGKLIIPKGPSLRGLKTREARRKRVEKAFWNCGYTPLAAGFFAATLCDVSEAPEVRRKEVLGLIQRVINGGDK